MSLEADASPFLKKHLRHILAIDRCKILDAPCGAGRNALFLQDLGLNVTAVDISKVETQKLESRSLLLARGSMATGVLDLTDWPWNLENSPFDVILSVHFIVLEVIPFFADNLKPNGLLLIETFGNQGKNYLQLPKKGDVKIALKGKFNLVHYSEKKAGPPEVDAVTVKCLARKHP